MRGGRKLLLLVRRSLSRRGISRCLLYTTRTPRRGRPLRGCRRRGWFLFAPLIQGVLTPRPRVALLRRSGTGLAPRATQCAGHGRVHVESVQFAKSQLVGRTPSPCHRSHPLSSLTLQGVESRLCATMTVLIVPLQGEGGTAHARARWSLTGFVQLAATATLR